MKKDKCASKSKESSSKEIRGALLFLAVSSSSRLLLVDVGSGGGLLLLATSSSSMSQPHAFFKVHPLNSEFSQRRKYFRVVVPTVSISIFFIICSTVYLT